MRLFELLRQKNRADTTVARVKGFAIRKISADEAEQIKSMAQRSFARPD
jgi:ribosomal protein L31E